MSRATVAAGTSDRFRGEPYGPPTPGWNELSAGYTRLMDALTGTDTIVVKVAPGAGRGAPGCFIRSKMQIELDGALVDGVAPAGLDPARGRDRARIAVLHGVACHEAGHAVHSLWTPPDGTGPAQMSAMTVLEEVREEHRHLSRRPGDARWIRAAATRLILDETAASAAPADGPWGAARTAALLLGRADTGVLSRAGVKAVDDAVTDVLGSDVVAALRAVWNDALAVADDDGQAMAALGAHWCELVGTDADADDPDGITGPAPAAGGGGTPGTDGGSSGGTPGPADGADDEETGTEDPVTAAARGAAEEAAAGEADEIAAEQAADAAEQAARDARKAARAAESARHADAARAADETFSPSKSSGPRGRGSRSRWTEREPRNDEKIAAKRIADRLRKAQHRDRRTVKVRDERPGGTLVASEALRRSAEKSSGRRPTARPWEQDRRLNVEEPPLRVGIVVDVSSSGCAYVDAMSSAAWSVAQAVGQIDGQSATATFGYAVTGVIPPGRLPGRVRVFTAPDGTEEFVAAVDAVDGALDLVRGNGAKLLVVVSDGCYRPDQRTGGEDRVRRLVASGCGVLWLTFDEGSDPIPGAVEVRVTDESAVADLIGRAAARLLETA